MAAPAKIFGFAAVATARDAASQPDRTAPSMVAGRPVWTQSPARKTLLHRVREGGRLASCAGVAAKVARFSLTIRHGGRAGRQSGQLGDLAPDALGERFARPVDEVAGGADRDRKAVAISEQPLRQAADHAEDRRMALRRRDEEMRVDDPPEFLRRLDAGQKDPGRPRRNRDDDRVVPSENDGIRLEFERDRAVGCEANVAQTVAEAHGSAPAGDEADRRIDECRGQSLRCDQGSAGFPAAPERPAQERARQEGRAFFRIGVEAGEQERPPQALVERAVAPHRALDGGAGGRPEEGERREIFLQRRPRRPPLPVEQPPGRASLVGAQPPAFAAFEDRRSRRARAPGPDSRSDEPIRAR